MRYILLLACFGFLSSCFNCTSYLNENIRPLKIDGIVVDKKKSGTGCFGIIIWKHQDKLDTLTNVCYCVPAQKGLWNYITKGDSLHKAETSLAVDVYRNDSLKSFEYPCCSQ